MDKTLKKFLPLGGFMVAFSGGLALHFVLAFQFFGIVSINKDTVICYLALEPLFFIISFIITS